MIDDKPFNPRLLLTAALAASLLLVLGWPTLARAEEGISTTQTVSPSPAVVGQPVTFTITVTNGSVDQSVGVKDFLPSYMTFVSATPSQGTCDTSPHRNNVVGCALGVIPSGGSATVGVVAVPTLSATMTNTAVGVGDVSPATPANSNSTNIAVYPSA